MGNWCCPQAEVKLPLELVMAKIKGVVQLLVACICVLLVLATAVNLGFILLRPESVSVANSLIGQSVLIICFLAAARVLSRKGLVNLRSAENPSSTDSP